MAGFFGGLIFKIIHLNTDEINILIVNDGKHNFSLYTLIEFHDDSPKFFFVNFNRIIELQVKIL